jgi:glutamate synthase (NADPH/NADH) small chain
LTTAIGQASIAVEGIDTYLQTGEAAPRPKVDSHHFSILDELQIHSLQPAEYDKKETWGTDEANFAVHNYEERSFAEIVPHDQLFLGHFQYQALHPRKEVEITANQVLDNFKERFSGLSEKDAIAEAKRCMSCGMCFECDNCLIFCPQDAIFKVKKDKHVIGRYVDTDYNKCVGCHICMDVCPTGYIQMGL